MKPKRFLAVPINNDAETHRLCITEQGTPSWLLTLNYDPVSPAYEAYIPMDAFLGKDIGLSLDGKAYDTDLPAGFRFADAVPDAYEEPLRPQVHFSPLQGWNNDPNGLVWYKGFYHLFFQHNPAGNIWGNMHWGHAVSTDLLHWKELPIALYPDMENGKRMDTIFSGSAIVDTRNVTGLGDHPLVLLYTSSPFEDHTGREYDQRLAYSPDGMTFHKYPDSPVIPHAAESNRDPKVVWCEELSCYLCVVYLVEQTYIIYRSDNLLSWRELQCVTLEGDNECPDLYPLTLDGERYWILSGAHDCYLVGRMTPNGFEPVQEVRRMLSGYNYLYAAQTFSDLPDGRRIRISWAKMRLPGWNGMRWNCQMSTPVEMYLERDAAGIALCLRPIRELESLYCPDAEAAAWEIDCDIPEGTEALTVFGVSLPLEGIPFREGFAHARIIADRVGVEAYFGSFYAAADGICDFSAPAADPAVARNIRVQGLRRCIGG